MSQRAAAQNLKQLFGFFISGGAVNQIKVNAAKYYANTWVRRTSLRQGASSAASEFGGDGPDTNVVRAQRTEGFVEIASANGART